MRIFLRFALLAICCAALFADQITLKNGDRITGDVVKKDAKSITIKTKAFGVITAAWDDVESLSTEQPVTVELQGGEVLKGAVSATREAGKVQEERATHEVTLGEIAIMRNAAQQAEYERLQAPPWTRLWAGNATLGFAGTKGNAKTLTFTTGLDAARVTRNDKTTVHFTSIKATALVDNINATTAQAVRGGWGYDRNLTSRFFVNTFNDYEYDRFQNLDLRFVLGGGFGYAVIKTDRTRLDFLGGGAYNRESFGANDSQPAFTRQSGEAYAGNEFSMKVNSSVSLVQSSRFFPNLTNTGEYRFNFDAGATTKLTRWLTWNTTLSNRLLSNPLPGRVKNDLLYSTGFGITFLR